MKISVARGDGVGPEMMDAVLEVLEAAGVPLTFEAVEMGAAAVRAGATDGIGAEARRSVESTGVLLKGPMQGATDERCDPVSVAARKLWGTYASKRIYRAVPGVPCEARGRRLSLTLVCDTAEDAAGAIEHVSPQGVAQCRRLISRAGAAQVHRYAFELAARKGATRITCAHRADVMPVTDGVFLEEFYAVARDYPQITADDDLVGSLALRLMSQPDALEVLVAPSLHGDLLGDIAAGLVGGRAYAPSANVGDGIAIFEPVHGPMPELVGRDRANPTALLLSATMMLRHLGLLEPSRRIEAALKWVLHDMHRRPDLAQPIPPFSTSLFVSLMREQLAEAPPRESAAPQRPFPVRLEPKVRALREAAPGEVTGLDVFLESSLPPAAIAEQLAKLGGPARMSALLNRGIEVWPNGSVYTDCIPHYCARFEADAPLPRDAQLALIASVEERFTLSGVEWVRTGEAALRKTA